MDRLDIKPTDRVFVGSAGSVPTIEVASAELEAYYGQTVAIRVVTDYGQVFEGDAVLVRPESTDAVAGRG